MPSASVAFLLLVLSSSITCEVILEENTWKHQVEYYQSVSLQCASNSVNVDYVQAWILPNGMVIKTPFTNHSDRMSFHNEGRTLSLKKVDNEEFGVYLCVIETGDYRIQTIRRGVNVDGPYFGSKYLDKYKRRAMIGGIASGVLCIFAVSAWVIHVNCCQTGQKKLFKTNVERNTTETRQGLGQKEKRKENLGEDSIHVMEGTVLSQDNVKRSDGENVEDGLLSKQAETVVMPNDPMYLTIVETKTILEKRDGTKLRGETQGSENTEKEQRVDVVHETVSEPSFNIVREKIETKTTVLTNSLLATYDSVDDLQGPTDDQAASSSLDEVCGSEPSTVSTNDLTGDSSPNTSHKVSMYKQDHSLDDSGASTPNKDKMTDMVSSQEATVIVDKEKGSSATPNFFIIETGAPNKSDEWEPNLADPTTRPTAQEDLDVSRSASTISLVSSLVDDHDLDDATYAKPLRRQNHDRKDQVCITDGQVVLEQGSSNGSNLTDSTKAESTVQDLSSSTTSAMSSPVSSMEVEDHDQVVCKQDEAAFLRPGRRHDEKQQVFIIQGEVVLERGPNNGVTIPVTSSPPHTSDIKEPVEGMDSIPKVADGVSLSTSSAQEVKTDIIMVEHF